MNKITTLLITSFIFLSGANLSAVEENRTSSRVRSSLTFEQAKELTQPQYGVGLLRHIVLFKFRSDVTKDQVQEVVRRFMALHKLCQRNGRPYIASLESGFANSPEGADQGMALGFVVTFRSAGDRNYYVGQPLIDEKYSELYDQNHLNFKKFVGPLLATPIVPNGVVVFDFSVENREE